MTIYLKNGAKTMTNHDYKQNAYYLIYLIRCVLNNRVPAQEKLDKMNLSQLFEVAQRHTLTAICAYALESAGIFDKAFTEAKNKAIRKNIILDAEREKVFAEFEKAGIWYMPLKGIILKDYYPKIGMRQMADNDFLIDKNFQSEIKDIMISCGFKTEQFDKSKHDVYFKEPVCNFQMHISLFEIDSKETFYNYFKDIDKRLISVDDYSFAKSFTNEDFYLYVKAHEYKHYSSSGTGLRNLVDTYIYINKFGNALDWKYLNTELTKLDICDYEKNSRKLAMLLFSGQQLNDNEKEMLDYYIFSGTYGNVENNVNNKISKHNGNKLKYIVNRTILPISLVRKSYPMFYKYKILLPFLPFYRLIKNRKKNKKKILTEIKTLIKS